MFVIVGGTVAAGLLVTKILLLTHERSLAFRYGLAVVLAFAAFLGFVKIWLLYIAHKTLCADWMQAVDIDSDDVSGGGSDIGGPQFESGGGSSFGGGGAGGSWGPPVKVSTSSSSSGFNLGDICDSDDLGIVILVALLVLAIAAAAVYVIWAAPAILSEAAFQGALAAALTRKAKKIGSGGWVGSVFRATIVPFAVVLVFAVGLGWYAQRRCPAAARLTDAIRCVRVK